MNYDVWYTGFTYGTGRSDFFFLLRSSICDQDCGSALCFSTKAPLPKPNTVASTEVRSRRANTELERAVLSWPKAPGSQKQLDFLLVSLQTCYFWSERLLLSHCLNTKLNCDFDTCESVLMFFPLGKK